MRDVIVWWLAVQALAWLFFPLTTLLLRNLPDRGYSLAKTLGLLFPAYLFWVLSSLGFLDNIRSSILVVVLVAGCLSWLLIPQAGSTLLALWRRDRWTLVLVELLFFGGFMLWSWMRAFEPQISATEKPMEFAFLNGVLRSERFPPVDPWLAGHSISYYYFGYVIVGMLAKLTGVAAGISFNLAIALLFALTATGAFGIAYNLARAAGGDGSSATTETDLVRHPGGSQTGTISGPVWCGLLGALFVTVMGNLEGVLEIIHSRGWLSSSFWNWIGIQNLDKPYVSQHWYPSDWMWWFRASRVIADYDPVSRVARDYTINEFPFFSFFLGDLHPHVLALPFAITALGLALSVLLSKTAPTLQSLRERPWEFVGFSLLIGGLGFLNSWDMPTYALLLAGSFALKNALTSSRSGWKITVESALLLVFLLGAGIVLYLPFYLGFHSQASGIGVVLIQSKMHHFLIFWAPFLLLSGGFVLAHVAATGDPISSGAGLEPALEDKARPYVLYVAGGVVVAMLITRSSVALLLLGILLAGYSALRRTLESKTSPEASRREVAAFVILLIMLGAFLLLGTEGLYVRDLFRNRMNTVFKVYYQVWLLMAVVGAYVVYYFLTRWGPGKQARSTSEEPQRAAQPSLVDDAQPHPSGRSRGRQARTMAGTARVLIVAGLVLLAMAFVYPLAAINSRVGGFTGDPKLDGTAYLAATQREDYDAMKWLEANVQGTPVILEASGGSYSEYGRVSANTGFPTVLGWDGHETQWRGSGEEAGRRKVDVDTIYSTTDSSTALRLLQKYRVDYVYAGSLERRKYSSVSPAWLNKFYEIGDVVYQNREVTIFKVRVEKQG